jgi:hypothetical protein
MTKNSGGAIGREMIAEVTTVYRSAESDIPYAFVRKAISRRRRQIYCLNYFINWTYIRFQVAGITRYAYCGMCDED